MKSVILPPNTPILTRGGNLAAEWYRYFCTIQRDISSGETETANALLSATAGFMGDFSTASEDALLSPSFLQDDAQDIFPPVSVERVNLDDAPGLVEQTGFDTFTKRGIGVAASTDVLTRADGDARYTGGSSSLNIRTIAATGAPASDDYTLLCNAASGAITVNLPAAASSAKRALVIKKIDASANAITIDPNGAEVIDGAATLALSAQWQSAMIHCNGTAWYVI